MSRAGHSKSERDVQPNGMAVRHSIDPQQGSVLAPRIFGRSDAGLLRLLEGYEYAQALQHSVWDFALEIQFLNRLDFSNNKLRWLVCCGYVKHAREISTDVEEHRAFEPAIGRLTFDRSACFVLTAAGAEFVRSMMNTNGESDNTNGESDGSPNEAQLTIEVPTKDAVIPQWDRDRQELRLGDLVVKRFKVPAPNQVTILAAFQEESWPVRIDDPLPPRFDVDPKRRLHDTVNSLNRSQKNRLVQFQGDGSGQGVRWELA